MGGDVVSGEAVVLELRLAKLPSRSLAIIIDLTLQVGLLLVFVFLLGATAGSLDSALVAAVSLVVTVGVVLGYPILFETLTRGRSLGKLVLGLRVVRDDGGPIRFRHSLVRALLGLVEIWLTSGVVAILASLASTKGKRLGDQLAGTVVIRERVPVQRTPMATMPPWLAGWAAQADLARLPDDLALAARQFLARSGELSPGVRTSMGRRIAGDVVRYVAPPPPPGTPVEAFLAAVLAERRRREEQQTSPGAVAAPVAPPVVPPPMVAPPEPPAAPPAGFAPPG
jgi:uncharacterized RDD family membrane protein YckC